MLSWLLAQQFQSGEVRSVFSQHTRAGTEWKGPHTNPSPTFPFIGFLWGGDFLQLDHTLAECVSLNSFRRECVHVHVLGPDKLLICEILDVLFQWMTASCVVTLSCPIEKQSKCVSFDGSVLCLPFFSLLSIFFTTSCFKNVLSEKFPVHCYWNLWLSAFLFFSFFFGVP